MSKSAKTEVLATFRASQAARLAGLSLAMVNYLCRHEIVMPTGSAERGRGRPRLYGYADVLLLRVMAQLLTQGVSVLGLRKSLSTFRGASTQLDIARCRYFVTDGYNVLLRDADRLEDVTSGQQVFAFVLDLQPVREAVDKNMKVDQSVVNG